MWRGLGFLNVSLSVSISICSSSSSSPLLTLTFCFCFLPLCLFLSQLGDLAKHIHGSKEGMERLITSFQTIHPTVAKGKNFFLISLPTYLPTSLPSSSSPSIPPSFPLSLLVLFFSFFPFFFYLSNSYFFLI